MRHRTPSKKVTPLSHSNFLCQFENFSHQSINHRPTEVEDRMRHQQCRNPKHINRIGGIYG